VRKGGTPASLPYLDTLFPSLYLVIMPDRSNSLSGLAKGVVKKRAIRDCAAYIQEWLQKLKNGKTLLIPATIPATGQVLKSEDCIHQAVKLSKLTAFFIPQKKVST
jgi:hypothetical protein